MAPKRRIIRKPPDMSFESTHGADNILSTTVPPVDGRNVHLAGQGHPVTGGRIR